MAGSILRRSRPGQGQQQQQQQQQQQHTTVAALRHPVAASPDPHTHTHADAAPDSDDRGLPQSQHARMLRLDRARAAAHEPAHLRARYGPLTTTHALAALPTTLDRIQHGYADSCTPLDGTLAALPDHLGQRVAFRARIHTARPLSARLLFLLLRTQLHTVQAVLHADDDHPELSTHMLRWAQHLPAESIVHVTGTVQHPHQQQQVHSASIHAVELRLESIHLLARARDLRFHVYSAELSAKAHADDVRDASTAAAIGDGSTPVNDDDDGEDEEEEEEEGRPSDADSHRSTRTQTKSIQHISLRTRLANRIIDLRTPATLSVFRLQAALCTAFRAYLSERGFLEIHTPKLQAAATESGSSVFKVDYFGRAAFLAQSPQLAKQMAIAGDFGRVFEIGPVFRAENSNTHRHVTEFTGLDIELTIQRDYHEVMHLIDATLKHMFSHIYTHHRPELDAVQAAFPHADLVWLDNTPVLRFDQAVRMLTDAGWTDDDGKPLREDEDLGTRDEIRLGELVKEKYATDYFIIDKFPASARPFYAMPDADDPKWTNTFDFFLRGQEILTGGQRIHQLKKLERAMARNGIQPEDLKDYCEAFQFGAPAHGGAGIGLERLLMLLLQLGDIRNASLFPRDPQSLPAKPPQTSLRFPEASTVHPPWERAALESGDPMAHFDDELDEDEVEAILREGGPAAGLGEPDAAAAKEANLGKLQPLGKLIANYGQSSSTALLDSRYRIWRHAETGAAVSYVPVDRFAVVVGNPLCDAAQYARVVRHFLGWLKRETQLRPIWILVNGAVEAILGQDYGWCTLSCIAEERASTLQNPAFHDAEVQRRVRHAAREGVKIADACALGERVEDAVVQECEEGMRRWLEKRRGKQAHLTQLNPWRDMEHRHYSIARDREGRIVALVVLAMLSKAEGFQVKYALDWDPAPSGTIEAITLHAVKAAASLGAQRVTFGAGAAPTIQGGHNMGKLQAAALRRTYKSIVASRGLARKTAFRAKMGADDSAAEDRLWVTYPKGGLGARGIRALLAFFGDPDEDEDEGSEGETPFGVVEEDERRGRGPKVLFAKLPFGGGGRSSSRSKAASSLSPHGKRASTDGGGPPSSASATSPKAEETAAAAGSPSSARRASASSSGRELSATSKAEEDEESGKQQIVHSTRAVQGEERRGSAGSGKSAQQQHGRASTSTDATAVVAPASTSSTIGREAHAQRNTAAGAGGKKRLSGLWSSVFHRQQQIERHADVCVDQPQPPPDVRA